MSGSRTPAAAKALLVTTTLATARQARALADAIVAARLAACVQMLPIRSTYRWQGKVEHAAETLLLAKTTPARRARLMAFIRARHPYTVPELIAIPITHSLPAYLRWITGETRPERRQRA